MVELLQTLSNKMAMHSYLLSNANVDNIYWGRMEASKYFNGTLISAHVHSNETQSGHYLSDLPENSSRSAECVFIDDYACKY